MKTAKTTPFAETGTVEFQGRAFTETTREITIALPSTPYAAKIIISRDGQQPPDEGDAMRVTAELHLPATLDTCQLPPELRFGQRVTVWNESLSSTWGEYHKPTHTRVIRSTYIHATYPEAFAWAEKCVRGKLSVLVDALLARQAIATHPDNQ